MPNVCGHLALVDSAWTSGAAAGAAGNGHKHRFTCTPLCIEEIQMTNTRTNTNTTNSFRAKASESGEKAQAHLYSTLSRMCCFQRVWLKLYFKQTLQCAGALWMQTSKTLKSLTQSKMLGKQWEDDQTISISRERRAGTKPTKANSLRSQNVSYEMCEKHFWPLWMY